MTTFVLQQMDYVLFIYGLSFMLLGGVCLYLSRGKTVLPHELTCEAKERQTGNGPRRTTLVLSRHVDVRLLRADALGSHHGATARRMVTEARGGYL